MSKFIEVDKKLKLEDGSMKGVLVADREILIAKVAGKYYASDNRCPHLGGKLSEGQLNGTTVTCPRHGSQFDLVDGNVVRWLKGSGFTSKLGRMFKSPKPLNIYNVKTEDDRILVEI